MDLTDYLKKRKSYLEGKILLLENNLREAPAGSLLCIKSNGYYRWYVSSDSSSRKSRYAYLGKKDHSLIRSLIIRDLSQAKVKDYKRELAAVDHYLYVLDDTTGFYRKLTEKCTQYLPFLEATSYPLSKKIESWLAEDYPVNPDSKDYSVKAQNGLMVRSKSEALIIRLFLEHSIPFRYECPLKVFDITYYPDFTIMHPRTGQLFLWEHFGLMERDYYAAKNAKKVADYRKLGFFPYKNLIMTFEYSDTAFDITIIEEMINRYLT